MGTATYSYDSSTGAITVSMTFNDNIASYHGPGEHTHRGGAERQGALQHRPCFHPHRPRRDNNRVQRGFACAGHLREGAGEGLPHADEVPFHPPAFVSDRHAVSSVSAQCGQKERGGRGSAPQIHPEPGAHRASEAGKEPGVLHHSAALQRGGAGKAPAY